MNQLVEVDYSDREAHSKSNDRYINDQNYRQPTENPPFNQYHHERRDSSDLLYRNLQKMQTPERETMQTHPSFGNIKDRRNTAPHENQNEA